MTIFRAWHISPGFTPVLSLSPSDTPSTSGAGIQAGPGLCPKPHSRAASRCQAPALGSSPLPGVALPPPQCPPHPALLSREEKKAAVSLTSCSTKM